MEVETKDIADLLQLFKSGNSESKKAFIEACPPSFVKDDVMNAISRPYLEINLAGLNLLAESYCRGQDPRIGVMLSKVSYILSMQAFEEHLDKSLDENYLFIVGISAITTVIGLHSLGKHNELISVIAPTIKWLDARKEYEQYSEHKSILMLYWTQAHIDLAQFDDAERLLGQTKWESLNSAYKLTLEGLRKQFAQLAKQKASELPRTQIDLEFLKQGKQDILDRLKTVDGALESEMWDKSKLDSQGYGSMAEWVEEARQLSEKLKSSPDPSGFTSRSNWAVDSQATMNELSDFITRRSSTGSNTENQTIIRNASMIFHDPVKGRDPQEIKRVIPILVEAEAWARKHNIIDNQNDALWTLYLCYVRTGRDADAINVLQKLRSNLEELRKRISDPLERAGAMIKYPILFSELCWLLCKNNRPAELLDAMEGAKGRVIADILTQKSGQIISDTAFSDMVQQLPALMQQVRAHYLSYLVGDEETYAILVAKDGSMHTHMIPFGKSKLREWAKEINPKAWGTAPKSGILGHQIQIPSDLPDRLAPLTSWLEPLAESGLLREGDHICYCPDEELHLVPLHYVTFQGKPFVNYVSLSRTHSAFALLTILRQGPVRFEKFKAVQIPAQSDRGTDAKINAFGQAPNWLEERFPGQIMSGEAIDMAIIEQSDWKYHIVHFATHGTFPSEGSIDRTRDPNPYSGSGLVLAYNKQLPDLSSAINGKVKGSLLTPKKVLDLDFSGSHVTMQACVSGLAKDGIGGDALGLEWAFLQAGATSLLATHWNVDAVLSADFSVRFYQKWLVNKLSRAAAWRETVLELMNSEPNPYNWASVSLSGDWR